LEINGITLVVASGIDLAEKLMKMQDPPDIWVKTLYLNCLKLWGSYIVIFGYTYS